MTSTMDRRGRLVIPKSIRHQAGLKPGFALDIRAEDGVIEIQAQPQAVVIERRGRLLVANPVARPRSLTHKVVEETCEALRKRR